MGTVQAGRCFKCLLHFSIHVLGQWSSPRCGAPQVQKLSSLQEPPKRLAERRFEVSSAKLQLLNSGGSNFRLDKAHQSWTRWLSKRFKFKLIRFDQASFKRHKMSQVKEWISFKHSMSGQCLGCRRWPHGARTVTDRHGQLCSSLIYFKAKVGCAFKSTSQNYTKLLNTLRLTEQTKPSESTLLAFSFRHACFASLRVCLFVFVLHAGWTHGFHTETAKGCWQSTWAAVPCCAELYVYDCL